jgi:hypothetical protein
MADLLTTALLSCEGAVGCFKRPGRERESADLGVSSIEPIFGARTASVSDWRAPPDKP